MAEGRVSFRPGCGKDSIKTVRKYGEEEKNRKHLGQLGCCYNSGYFARRKINL